MPAAAPEVTAETKRQDKAIARGALASITVHVSRDDRGRVEYLASRWVFTKAFSSLDELEVWLDRVGAPA